MDFFTINFICNLQNLLMLSCIIVSIGILFNMMYSYTEKDKSFLSIMKETKLCIIILIIIAIFCCLPFQRHNSWDTPQYDFKKMFSNCKSLCRDSGQAVIDINMSTGDCKCGLE